MSLTLYFDCLLVLIRGGGFETLHKVGLVCHLVLISSNHQHDFFQIDLVQKGAVIINWMH
jgi:hypothetical protein